MRRRPGTREAHAVTGVQITPCMAICKKNTAIMLNVKFIVMHKSTQRSEHVSNIGFMQTRTPDSAGVCLEIRPAVQSIHIRNILQVHESVTRLRVWQRRSVHALDRLGND